MKEGNLLKEKRESNITSSGHDQGMGNQGNSQQLLELQTRKRRQVLFSL
jgi:hypothetical protein